MARRVQYVSVGSNMRQCNGVAMPGASGRMKVERKHGAMTLEITFRIEPSHRVEFLQTADSLMSSTSDASGLHALSCFEKLGEENSFLWRESWSSSAELEDRLETAAIKTLMGAIEVLGDLESLEILSITEPGVEVQR